MNRSSITSEEDRSFKILIVGNSGVGKTSFINSCLNQLSQVPTVTTSVQQKCKTYEENQVEIVFVDTPGNSKYINQLNRQFKSSQYYQILIYMFSLNNKQSFQNVQSYWANLCQHLKIKYSILIGHKCDQRKMYALDAINLARTIKASAYYESSTKLGGQNSVQNILKKIINIIKERDGDFFETCESSFFQNQLQKKSLNKNKEQQRVEIYQETEQQIFLKQKIQRSSSNWSQNMQTSKIMETQSCLQKKNDAQLMMKFSVQAKQSKQIKQSKNIKTKNQSLPIDGIKQQMDITDKQRRYQKVNKGASCSELRKCQIM